MNIKQVSFFCLVLVSAAMFLSCTGKKGPAAKAPVSVSVVTVSGAGGSLNREYVGSVVEREGTSLSFEVPGNIVSLRADNGDRVAKGQLLATIDPSSLRDAHQLALSTLRQAQDAYRRFEPLHKQGVLSDIKWVEVQTKLEQAQSSERLARTQLSRTSLVAPFSGVISSRTAERGMNVMAGQQVFRLVDISKIDVKVSVPEGEVSGVSVGERARVTVSALGGRSYDAVVKDKGVEANAVSHTYDVKLAVTSGDGRLMPGMVCSVMLCSSAAAGVSGGAAAELSVPIDAVKLDSDNRRFVWLAVGGKAKQQYVTIGDFTEGGVAVTSGLSAGDKVITGGSQKVSQGMAVRVRN